MTCLHVLAVRNETSAGRLASPVQPRVGLRTTSTSTLEKPSCALRGKLRLNAPTQGMSTRKDRRRRPRESRL